MTDPIFTDDQRSEIKTIVHEALAEFFRGYSLIGKNVLVTTAVIVRSLTVILGGAKAVLGWLGYSMLSK